MAKTAREQELDRSTMMEGFVKQSSWQGAVITPLAQDVSVRKFFRLVNGDKTAILMDARPPLEDTAMFEFMRNKFDKIGLNVPEIYETDHDKGFVIMEDFGDERCYELVSSAKKTLDDMHATCVGTLVKKHAINLKEAKERCNLLVADDRKSVNKIYEACVDVLIHKYKADPEVALDQSVAYSDDYWLFRVEQFLLHYMPHVVGREPTEKERKKFLSLFKDAIANSHGLDDVLLHGDYGVQNIYYFKDTKSVGLIDFQDMTDARGNMMSSPAFDLVFLLQDVRTAVSDDLEQEMKQRFIDGVGFTQKQIEQFNKEYAIIGTAQAVKCLGLFARLSYVDKRDEYLKFLPNCLRSLNKNLSNPELKAIKAWFKKSKIEI